MNLLSSSLLYVVVSHWLVGFTFACNSACNSQFVNCQGLCTQQYGSSPSVYDCKNQCVLNHQLCCPAPVGGTGGTGDGSSAQPAEETEAQKLFKICKATFEVADTNKDFMVTKEEYFQHATLYAEKICPQVARTKTYTDSQFFSNNYNVVACSSCIGSLDPTDPASANGTWETCGCETPATSNPIFKPSDTPLEVEVYCAMVHSLAYIQCHQPEDACLNTCIANDDACWGSCTAQYQTNDSRFFICLYQCEPSFLTCINNPCSTTNAVITTDAANEKSGSTAISATSKFFTFVVAALIVFQQS